MTVHYFKSSDAGAPVLTGQTGSLIELLDACLIDGYGDLDPAGWEIAFSGTDKRVYRSPIIGGTRHYYRLRHDGAGPGGNHVAYLRGFHTMTDVDTGFDPYPAPGQRTHGVTWVSANGADSDPRGWSVVATDKTVVVFIQFSPSSTVKRICLAFGEFQPVSPADVGAGFVSGFSVDGEHSSADNALNRNVVAGVTQGGAWISSSPDGALVSVQAGMGEAGKGGSSNGFGVSGASVFPNPHFEGAVLLPVLIHDTYGVRGAINLLFSPGHNTGGYPANDVEFTGLDGTKYCWQRLWNQVGGGSENAAVVVRISE